MWLKSPDVVALIPCFILTPAKSLHVDKKEFYVSSFGRRKKNAQANIIYQVDIILCLQAFCSDFGQLTYCTYYFSIISIIHRWRLPRLLCNLDLQSWREPYTVH